MTWKVQLLGPAATATGSHDCTDSAAQGMCARAGGCRTIHDGRSSCFWVRKVERQALTRISIRRLLIHEILVPRNGRSRPPCYRRLRQWQRPPHHRRTSPPPILISSVRLRILARNATCQIHHRRLVFCRTSISEPLGADKIDEPKYWSRGPSITRH